MKVRAKCPVPHEVDRFHEVVPLELCGLCKGTGFIEPDNSLVKIKVAGHEVELVRTDVLGMLWICDCRLFNLSKTVPPFCLHTMDACERVRQLRGG